MKNYSIQILIVAALVLAGIWIGNTVQTETNQAGRDQMTENVNGGPAEISFITVHTENKETIIPIEGRLRAENRLEIFPEVQGKILELEKPFREGTTFLEGESLIRLDAEEARLQLNASRSGFQSQVASLMPDIKLDYPDALPEFDEWFNSLNLEQTLPPIPEAGDSQLKRFLSSRGIFDSYYRIKSAEIKFEKFTIRAPFTGVVSAVHVEPGQSVSPQNHLGTFVDPDRFILTALVHQNRAEQIPVGAELTVTNREETVSVSAVINRMNPSVDSGNQMVEIYLDVVGNGLREGMYLEGVLPLSDEPNLAKIPKSALLRTGHVYVNRDGVIREVAVTVSEIEKDWIWVIGLNEGDEIVANSNRALAGLEIQ
jgi:multidrug efflux pump subunit AcrA (membrane-fusion protein)